MNESIELVKKGFAAFADGDLTLDSLIADDVVSVSTGNGILSGRFEGKQALFANWAKIPAETGGTFQQDVVEVFGDDRVVVAITEAAATRGDKQVEKARAVDLFVIKDAKVTQGRVTAGDPDEDDAFWAA